MKPPVECDRAHLPQSDPRCDTVTVLNMAALRRPSRRFADMNAVGVWNLHWEEGPGLNQYTHIVDHGKLRPMTHAELHRPVLDWPEPEILLWRKNVGTEKKPKWARPFRVDERQKQANRRLVYVTWELKSPEHREPTLAHRFVSLLKAVGGRWCVMTLVNMRWYGEKLTAFKDAMTALKAGRGTALLAHDEPRPADLHEFYPSKIDRIWGRFR